MQYNNCIATNKAHKMHTYTVLVEFYNNIPPRTIQVQTDANLQNGDADILASVIEQCLEEEHGVDMDELAHWEFITK